MKLRIVCDSFAERGQSVLILRTHQHRRVAVALGSAGKRIDIDPDFRLESLAGGVKQANNRVVGSLNPELVADIQPLKPFRNALRNHSFSQTRLQLFSSDNIESRAQFERHWTNTTHGHVRALAHSLASFVNQRNELAGGHRLFTLADDSIEINQVVEVLACQ